MLKLIANLAASAAVLPIVVAFAATSRIGRPQITFEFWVHSLALLPGLPGAYFRRAFYKSVLRQCGNDFHIGFGTVFSHPTVSIGRRAYFGVYCVIGDVTIEDDVLIGSHVSVMNGNRQHGIERMDIPVREQPGDWPRVTIGRDTWIGDRAIVMADVGRHCVVGAGAVVTKPVPDLAIVVGSPARIISFRVPSRQDATGDTTSAAESVGS